MQENVQTSAGDSASYVPDAETRADAESLDYKQITSVDASHQVQTKAGAIAGALGGAGVGAVVAGLPGALIGAGIGAVAGGFGGKAEGEMFDPSAEFSYWQTHHDTQPFVDNAYQYTDYEPGYRAGYNNYTPGGTFDKAEDDIRRYYEQFGGQSRLNWDKARPAAKAAWDRMAHIFPLEKMNHF